MVKQMAALSVKEEAPKEEEKALRLEMIGPREKLDEARARELMAESIAAAKGESIFSQPLVFESIRLRYSL